MDDVDRADFEVERNLQEAARNRRPAGPVAHGRCHYCDEIVADGHRFCGAECRDQWEALTCGRR